MMTTDLQWNEKTFGSLTEGIEQALLTWSYSTEHPIKRVMVFCRVPEYVPATIWIFSDTIQKLEQWKVLGYTRAIASHVQTMAGLSGAKCEFDSEENIELNHEGNYHRRIRPRHGL